jgi:hypothetical protein
LGGPAKVFRTALKFLRSERRAILPIATISTGVALLFSSLTLSSFLVSQARFLTQTYLISPDETTAAARALAVISLLVGATETGVVMSRIVSARIKVIGVMRASGIRDRVVFSLFILEAGFYGAIGAFVGLLVGVGVVLVVGVSSVGTSGLLSLFGGVAGTVFICVSTAVLVSVASALYPCLTAIRIPVVKAIYHD